MSDSCFCPLFPSCSGCKHLETLRVPPVWEEIASFFKEIHPFEVMLVSKEIVHWRSRVKLAVQGSSKSPKIGLFEEGSHSVIDMKTCPMHSPSINKALEEIRKQISLFDIEPYFEKKHEGRLRYLQMVTQRKTNLIQLSLVFNAKDLKTTEKMFVKQLYNLGLFHSIWINYLPEKTNTIIGRNWELVEGEEDFFQAIGNISFEFHPSCFAQAHLSLFEEMISYIDSLVEEGKSLLELYAGVGCIGLSLSHKVRDLTLVESSPYAQKSFEKTLKNLLSSQKKTLFLSKKAEDVEISSEVVLVDPPRKGLSKECKRSIFQSKAKQLIYVSCGYESFKRDSLEFLEKGWKIQSARGFLLFPGTNHVEIVASFEKLDP